MSLGVVEPLRALLFVEALAAFLMYAQLAGKLWSGTWRGRVLISRRSLLWAFRTTLAGFGGVLLYVTSGQIKAVQIEAGFDIYAWIGLASVTVTDVGLAWLIREQRRHEWG